MPSAAASRSFWLLSSGDGVGELDFLELLWRPMILTSVSREPVLDHSAAKWFLAFSCLFFLVSNHLPALQLLGLNVGSLGNGRKIHSYIDVSKVSTAGS